MARRNQDRDQRMFKDAAASESDLDRGSPERLGGSLSTRPKRDIITLLPPASETQPAAERPAEPDRKTERPAGPPEREANPGAQPDAQGEKPGQSPSKGWLRRHPLIASVGLVALALAAVAGYLYWDHTSHFESTDDAFIAARQFAIAPEVGGYVTAVPVTDNEHVNKGAVVAQIDQRPYRVGARAGGGPGERRGSRHPQH